MKIEGILKLFKFFI